MKKVEGKEKRSRDRKMEQKWPRLTVGKLRRGEFAKCCGEASRVTTEKKVLGGNFTWISWGHLVQCE